MRPVKPQTLQHEGRRAKTPRRSPVGSSPGTLIADPKAIQSALSLTVMSPEEFRFYTDVSLADLEKACGEWPIIWLDCVGLGNVELISEIGRIFGLHPLALEDTINTGQRAKVDFFEDHAFVVLSMIDDTTQHRYEQIIDLLRREVRRHLPGAAGRSLQPGAQAHRIAATQAGSGPARPTILPML